METSLKDLVAHCIVRTDSAMLLHLPRLVNAGVGELAEDLGLEISTVSMSIKRLRLAGDVYITKPDVGAQRSFVQLTPQGATKADDIRRAIKSFIAET